MNVPVRLFIFFVFLLLHLFLTLFLAERADAGTGPLLATETEGHELIRLASSEGPVDNDSSQKAGREGDSQEDLMGSDPWEDEEEPIDSIADPL